jgi:hypothetical protein
MTAARMRVGDVTGANATRGGLDAPPGRGIHSLRPALRWEDGFVTGNGTHGALAWGGARDEQVVITHHALVLPNSGTGRLPPQLAGQLPALRALLLAGDSAEALRRSCGGWEEWFPRAFHPAFAVTLRAPGDGATTHYRRAVDFRTGLLTTTWEDAAGRWRRSCFVSRARDVVVLRLRPPPGTTPDLEVTHEVSLPGAPPGLATHWPASTPTSSGILRTVHVDYPDPHTCPSSTHRAAPDQTSGTPGHVGGYAGITKIIAPGGDLEPDGRLTRIRGASEVTLLIKVTADASGAAGMSQRAPTADGRDGANEPPVAACLAALAGGYDALFTEHVRVHRACLGRVRLDLGASQQDRELPVEELLARQAAAPGRPPAALLEKLFDSGRYLLLCASGLLPPRLTGLWQGDWHAAWSGAIVGNANLNLQLAGAVTTDVPAAVHALARMIEAQLPDWRLNASRLHGARGVLAPASSDGFSGVACHFGPSYPHHLWTAGAGWLAVPLLDYADATGDETFLRERVLPLLIETATFYEDFLGPTAGEAGAGTVTFVPSYSPENHPGGGWSGAAINATMDIAAGRHALAAAADVCTRFGLDRGPGEGAERWLALRERLPHYRINADGALAEWAWPPTGPPLPDSYDHRHVSHLYPVWPLHDITAATAPAPPEPPPGEPSPGRPSPRTPPPTGQRPNAPPRDGPPPARPLPAGTSPAGPTFAEASPARPSLDSPPGTGLTHTEPAPADSSLAGPTLAGAAPAGAALAGAALAGAALRALELRGAENGSAHGLLHAGLAAARLRDATMAGERLAAIAGGYFFGGLVSGHYPGPDVFNCDAACCLPGLVAEMLVDSAPPRAGRPGWVELLPAVPEYLAAGRVSGLLTLAGIRVDLAWDLPAGCASAMLCAREDRLVDVVCRWAEGIRSRSVSEQKGPHAWRLRLRAGVAVRAEMRAEMEAHA